MEPMFDIINIPIETPEPRKVPQAFKEKDHAA